MGLWTALVTVEARPYETVFAKRMRNVEKALQLIKIESLLLQERPPNRRVLQRQSLSWFQVQE